MGKTLAEKVWDEHVVRSAPAGTAEPDLLYIDLHLIHEVTSPQAFDGLRLAGRKVRRPDLTLSSNGPRKIYLSAKTMIDRVAGGVLGVLGVRLILEGAQEAA